MSFQNVLDSSGKIQKNYVPASAESINGLTGAITLAGANGLTVTPAGQTITLTSPTVVTGLNAVTGAVTLVGSGAVTVTPAGQNITIDVPSAVTPTRQLLGNYSGTATGPSNSVALTSGGQSNITVVQGGVYALQGNFSLVASAGSWGFDLFINNGATDAKILAGNTTPYLPAGALSGVSDNFSCVFIAQGTTVQFFIASDVGAGALENIQASIATPELIRIA